MNYSFIGNLPHLQHNKIIESQCFLCHKDHTETKLTKEHLLPKILLNYKLNKNPIILRLCKDCNGTKSKEDEYNIRFIQSTSFAGNSHIDFRDAIKGVVSGNGIGIVKKLLNSSRVVNVNTKGGIYLGTTYTLELDKDRYENYIFTIAKGIYVRLTLQHYDWSNYEFNINYNQIVQDPNFFIKYKKEIDNCRYGETWEDKFSYYADLVVDNVGNNVGMIIFIEFYKSHLAMVVIGKKEFFNSSNT